ncbi:Uncharacterised protein [Burkholderia pseudomallei]|nr:Uncharacterised protein [Burkholderia pseudomallei]CAJ5242886.1 Uncharacterised protein [Burkholderia pseudomallei]CAJ5611343.1 Uncharacterised protein [Burkholderia pseudomallei]
MQEMSIEAGAPRDGGAALPRNTAYAGPAQMYGRRRRVRSRAAREGARLRVARAGEPAHAAERCGGARRARGLTRVARYRRLAMRAAAGTCAVRGGRTPRVPGGRAAGARLGDRGRRQPCLSGLDGRPDESRWPMLPRTRRRMGLRADALVRPLSIYRNIDASTLRRFDASTLRRRDGETIRQQGAPRPPRSGDRPAPPLVRRAAPPAGRAARRADATRCP